jgi:hypothetical protein
MSSYLEAVDCCRARVRRIASACRARGFKYRDVDFDLDDAAMARLPLGGGQEEEKSIPGSVKRVPEIFESPTFLTDDGATGDVIQGNIGDCWFIG